MSVSDVIGGITGQVDSAANVDYAQMESWIYAIQNISELILGMIVYIIIIGLPLVIAIELLYLNFPVLHSGIDEMMEKLGNSNRAKIIGFMFRDAKLAYLKANTTKTEKSAVWEYLLIKCKSVFIATFVIALALGAGPIIVQIITNIAEAMIRGFSGIII